MQNKFIRKVRLIDNKTDNSLKKNLAKCSQSNGGKTLSAVMIPGTGRNTLPEACKAEDFANELEEGRR